MEEAVSNTTVLILLSKINQLSLLKNIYYKIYIPNNVHDELMESHNDLLHTKLIQREISHLIIIEEPKNQIVMPLGKGEMSAISLAKEKNLIFLSDDKKARKYSQFYNLRAIGTLGILLMNVQKNKITKKQCMEYIDQLLSNGLYISSELYRNVMKQLL